MSEFLTLQYEERDGVAWVTLDRPDVHNAFNAQMQRDLEQCWRDLRVNDDVRCVVLTGAGERAFCAGIDRTEALADYDKLHEAAGVGNPSASPFMYDGARIAPKANDLWKPMVAAVNGIAAGGAFYLLGECDVLIAADHATFFDPHVTYGMTAAFESIHLSHRMPFGDLVRMQLMGNSERMSAARAHQVGLVSEVVPLAELREAAQRVAAAIAAAPTLAVQGTLRALWATRDMTRSQALDMGYSFIGLGNTRESLEQGQQVFADGRRVEYRVR